MAVAYIHAQTSAKIWGGVEEDYMAIHKYMDISKGQISDNRHRALTHHMFWVIYAMVPIFGEYIINSDNKRVSVKDICEKHILEDFRHKYIPSAADYLEELEMKNWMNNGLGQGPSSAKKLYREKKPGEEQKQEIID